MRRVVRSLPTAGAWEGGRRTQLTRHTALSTVDKPAATSSQQLQTAYGIRGPAIALIHAAGRQRHPSTLHSTLNPCSCTRISTLPPTPFNPPFVAPTERHARGPQAHGRLLPSCAVQQAPVPGQGGAGRKYKQMTVHYSLNRVGVATVTPDDPGPAAFPASLLTWLPSPAVTGSTSCS